MRPAADIQLPGTMQDDPDLNAMMGQAAFEGFDALCRTHPGVFSHASSPGAEELDKFGRAMRELSYVKAMLVGGYLKRAVRRLENGFETTMTILKPEGLSDTAWQALRAQKKLEREVRFVQRLASIAGPVDRPLPPLSPKDCKVNRRAAITALSRAAERLKVALRDEFLLEAIVPPASLGLLSELQTLLPQAVEALEAATPVYPIQRATDRAAYYQMVNRVVDACCRIYANCDLPTLGNLLDCKWLNRGDSYDDPRELMRAAIDRKQDAYRRRVPNEDYTDANLTGEWRRMPATWAPATTLDPPWMEA